MASTIQIKNSTTGGNSPSSLAQGEFAINVIDGNLFYGDGSNVKQDFAFGDITGSNAILSGTLTLPGIADVSASIADIVGESGADWNTNLLNIPAGLVSGSSQVVLQNANKTGFTGASSITTLGTIGTGVWQGTAIADAYISSATTWNNKLDSSGTIATNDYAKFNSSGDLIGRSYSEVKSDLSLNNVENTALSTWAGSSNLTTLGTVTSGNINTILPSGLVSGSSQININSTTGTLTTLGTVTSGDISAILPVGTVSGSSQIVIGSTTGTITSAKISDVDAFSQSGTYANLRAQATTADDVGLGNVTNESKATMFTNAALTGNPTAPTPLTSDNDTSIATTAFVKAQGYTTNTGTVDTSGTPVANDFAKFTDANTIEGRSYSEVKTDLSLNNVENTALSTWAGSSNLTTLGTVTSGDISAILPTGTVSGSSQIAIGSTTGTITSAKISDVDAFSQSGTYASLRAQGTTKGDVGLGNVENTALSTWAGSSNLVTLGTVTSGNINALLPSGLVSGSSQIVLQNANKTGFTGASSITTLGTIGTGVWQGTAIADGYISSATTWNNKLDSSGTITTNDYAKFDASGDLVGRSYAEVKTDLSLNNVENIALSTYTGNGGALDNQYITNGAGYTTNTGTVTSVGGTGTVSGLSLSGTVTTSGNLTLGGTISISSANITDVDAFSQTGTYVSLRAQGTTAGDVGLGNVENTALSTWAGSSNLTTLGTVTSGNINAILPSGTVSGSSQIDLGSATGTATNASTASYVAGSNVDGAVTLSSLATTAINATNAANVDISNVTGDVEYGLVFRDGNGDGNQALYADSEADQPSYNPSTNTITSPIISASSALYAGGNSNIEGTLSIAGIADVSASIAAASGGGGSGTVTEVTVGTGLDVTNGTTTPNITLDLTEITLSNGLDSTATGLSLDLTEVIANDAANLLLTTDGDGTLTAENITVGQGRMQFNAGDTSTGTFGMYTDLVNDVETATTIFVGDIADIGTSITTTAGYVCNFGSSGWAEAQADATSTSTSLLGIAASSATSNRFLLRGYTTLISTNFTGTFATGAPIYLSTTNSGRLNFSPPSSAGEVSRIIGHAIESVTIGRSTYYKIYFNPSPDWIEL